TECSCPDNANPCKHISAVYYLLGEQFDADPFLLFQLRGRSKDQIIADLRARRGAVTATGSASEISNFKSQIQGAVTATGSASEISNFKSQIRGAVTATGSASEISNFKSQMLIPGPGEQQTASAAPRAESFPENDFVSPDEHGSALEESLDRFWEGDPEIES